MPPRISLTQLAAKAGVSPATVSIVLNNRPLARHVAKDTKERILRLAEEHSYRPNHLARAMLQQATKNIAFICGDIATPFYSELADKLAQAAEARGYQLLMLPTRWSAEKERASVEMIMSCAVDGVVIWSDIFRNRRVDAVLAERVRNALLVFDHDADPSLSSVYFDVRPGMEALLARVTAAGIGQIALMDDPRFPYAREVVSEACRARGIALRRFEFSFGNGDSIDACVARVGRERPRLTIACSDYIATVLISRLGGTGLRVPEDLSVVSIDGTRWSELYNPPLTSIRVDTREMAEQAMDELIRRLNGAADSRRISVTTSLRMGRSVYWGE